MNIFESRRAPQTVEHAAAAERLNAVVNRGRLELPLYASIEVPTPEAVQRRFWMPEEFVANGNVE